MKGIILAGGSGTRLYPVTQVTCKQLLPIYDKPLIYYPLSVLMLGGIKEILIISTLQDSAKFQSIFGDGSYLGLSIKYEIQKDPKGLAEAFIIGEKFIGDDDVTLILGDNIFYGHGLQELIIDAIRTNQGATVFGYYVNTPQDYGVARFDKHGVVVSIEEKPKTPKSNYAITGLYIYKNSVINIAKSVGFSSRGELEITDINNIYLKQKSLQVVKMHRGYAWMDTGSHGSMLEASLYVKTIEERQGLKIACIEEIAYWMGYISKSDIIRLAQPLKKSGYGKYLLKVVEFEDEL